MVYEVKLTDNYQPWEMYLNEYSRELYAKDYTIIRLDGKGFHNVTKDMDKPYDIKFMATMDNIAENIMRNSGFRIIAAYIQSDEISILVDKNDNTFNRRSAKILSVFPSMVAGEMSLALGVPVAFDAKLWSTNYHQYIHGYFKERVDDCYRNFVNSYMYWTMREKNGISGTKAAKIMEGMNIDAMKIMLSEVYDVDLEEKPAREKYGQLLFWEDYKKDGYNPITKETVETDRRRISNGTFRPDMLPYRIEKVIHVDHKQGPKAECDPCKNRVPFCDYCRNSHVVDNEVAEE